MPGQNRADWITDNLKQKIRKTFEPRYKRTLTEEEIYQIAENMTDVVEELLKLKWRQKYEHTVSRS
jgi:tryptophan 2,3-dioxygenase